MPPFQSLDSESTPTSFLVIRTISRVNLKYNLIRHRLGLQWKERNCLPKELKDLTTMNQQELEKKYIRFHILKVVYKGSDNIKWWIDMCTKCSPDKEARGECSHVVRMAFRKLGKVVAQNKWNKKVRTSIKSVEERIKN